LNPKEVVDLIVKSGRPAFYEKDANTIVDLIVPKLKPNDIVAVFSNGGFDNIHEKLLAKLKA
jgi:UDP-N-acetylmuramate: L-alanyl-gamma-D-glutamyl-meso-diaminopimelate ligase